MDDTAKTFEVLGKSFDDTHVINVTCEMQDYGMAVRTSTLELTTAREAIPESFRHIGYTQEDGLYGRLRQELQKRKAQRQLERDQ